MLDKLDIYIYIYTRPCARDPYIQNRQHIYGRKQIITNGDSQLQLESLFV